MSESVEENPENKKVEKIPTTDSDPNEPKREKWNQKIEFLLTTLSFVVGFGNVWRFPYICYRNGGGVFLIPYFLCVVFLGIPVLLLEMTLGQYSAHGTITVWKFLPIFQGIGISMFIMVSILAIYYNTLLAWVIYYFIASFNFSGLPWKSCGKDWSTYRCKETNLSFDLNESLYKTPADEYFHRQVLGMTNSTDIYDFDNLNLYTSGCLFIAWFLIFLCLCKGIKSMGKVSYITAIFPYICLTILLVYGLTLEGSGDGIKYLFTPDWEKLLRISIWIDASQQIFYSLGLGWGTVITLSSYNHFDNHIIRDAIIIAFGNSFTSIFAACVIFAYMGSLAHDRGVNISDVATHGSGLAFIMYPEAVARFPGAQVFSVIFFFMMILLGLGSQNSTLESLLTTIFDLKPNKRKYKTAIVGLMCFAMFNIGLIFCTQAGMYYFQFVDQYCATTSALIIGFTEVMAVSWVYGTDKYMDHIKEMVGVYPTPRIYWKIKWKYICPSIIGILLLLSFIYNTTTIYNGYTYPQWTVFVGWALAMSSVLAIPIVALYYTYKYFKGEYKTFKELSNPDIDWKTKHN